jgi:hypothetical protein
MTMAENDERENPHDNYRRGQIDMLAALLTHSRISGTEDDLVATAYGSRRIPRAVIHEAREHSKQQLP